MQHIILNCPSEASGRTGNHLVKLNEMRMTMLVIMKRMTMMMVVVVAKLQFGERIGWGVVNWAKTCLT